MQIRHRPGILFLYVGVSLLATVSLLRQTLLPSIPYEYQLLSAVALTASVVVTYVLYIPAPSSKGGEKESRQ